METAGAANLFLALLLLLSLSSCERQVEQKPEAPEPRAADIPRLGRAIRRAVDWAGTIDVHPVRLRGERNMKGKKHFVEYLDLLHLAYKWPYDPELSRLAEARAREAWRATEEIEQVAVPPTIQALLASRLDRL